MSGEKAALRWSLSQITPDQRLLIGQLSEPLELPGLLPLSSADQLVAAGWCCHPPEVAWLRRLSTPPSLPSSRVTLTRLAMDERHHFAGLVAEALGEGVALKAALAVMALDPRFVAWQASWDEIPAAAAGLWLHGTLAVLLSAATLPAFRRRGLHQSLLSARLRYAAQRGATTALTLTSPYGPSVGNISRAGFCRAWIQVLADRDGPD